MRQVSKKQAARLRKFNRVKRELSGVCCICGQVAVDAAHLLPRSLYPEYYTETWNIVPMCRDCHRSYDDDKAFRKKQSELKRIVAEHDELAANRHFT